MRDIEIERRSKGYIKAVLKQAQCSSCKQIFQSFPFPELPALCGVGGREGHIYPMKLFVYLEGKFQIDYIDDKPLCGAPPTELTIYYFPRFLEEELFFRRELREFLFENFRELLEKPILFKHVIAFLKQEGSKKQK